jgi:acetyl/propionyl-CoA carboxylase alpha subunit
VNLFSKLKKINGHSQLVYAEKIKNTLWIHVDGQTYTLDLLSGQQRKSKSDESVNSGEIISPMPGKITKIFKSEKQNVQKGEPVLVMEAMKMEYTLKANCDGEISSVMCKLGDQVVLGKTLVKINPTNSNG